jgi:hypothetical protein
MEKKERKKGQERQRYIEKKKERMRKTRDAE